MTPRFNQTCEHLKIFFLLEQKETKTNKKRIIKYQPL